MIRGVPGKEIVHIKSMAGKKTKKHDIFDGHEEGSVTEAEWMRRKISVTTL